MIHLFDTRWATYEPNGQTRLMTEDEKADHQNPTPRYWVKAPEVNRTLEGRWDQGWFLGWRRIARATDERTLIATKLPLVALGDSIFVALTAARGDSAACLQAILSSYALDYVMRQKMGGTNASFYLIQQLPVPPPSLCAPEGLSTGSIAKGWVATKTDRLNGWVSDLAARARINAEADAAIFHSYGLSRPEVSHVMDTFAIVKRKDEAAHGSYRTKELILAAYDAMADALSTGRTYQSPWAEEVHA